MARVNLNGLVSVLKDIFSQSALIQGRFYVLRTINDLNTTNFGSLVKDNLSGLVEVNKYPCVVMRPPIKLKTNDQKGWATYKVHLYFLVRDKVNAAGAVKNEDTETNISMQTYVQDWSDTDGLANDFFNALFQYCQVASIMNAVHEKKDSRMYSYVSAIGADKVNGTCVSIDIAIWEGDNCNSLGDYPNPLTVNVMQFNPNTLNKQ